MGWSASPHSEAPRKRNLLAKRLRRLQAAVRSGEGEAHVGKAAEKYRAAALALIKAKRDLIDKYPSRDKGGRQAGNLREEEQHWLSLSVEAIIRDYASGDA